MLLKHGRLHRQIEVALKACEIWIGRKMGKVSWMNKKTNKEISHVVQENRKIWDIIWKHKHKRLGHVLRRCGMLRNFIRGKAVRE